MIKCDFKLYVELGSIPSVILENVANKVYGPISATLGVTVKLFVLALKLINDGRAEVPCKTRFKRVGLQVSSKIE